MRHSVGRAPSLIRSISCTKPHLQFLLHSGPTSISVRCHLGFCVISWVSRPLSHTRVLHHFDDSIISPFPSTQWVSQHAMLSERSIISVLLSVPSWAYQGSARILNLATLGSSISHQQRCPPKLPSGSCDPREPLCDPREPFLSHARWVPPRCMYRFATEN